MAVELALGPFELGRVVVHAGELWHAEVPGEQGAGAFSLLRQVASCDAHFRPAGGQDLPPRSIAHDAGHSSDDGVDEAQSSLLAQARKDGSIHLGEPSDEGKAVTVPGHLSLPPNPIPAGPEDSTFVDDGMQETYESFFRAGTQAYLRHDFPRALEAFEACRRLRPGDKRVLHNLERLKTRSRTP